MVQFLSWLLCWLINLEDNDLLFVELSATEADYGNNDEDCENSLDADSGGDGDDGDDSDDGADGDAQFCMEEKTP